MPTHLKKGKQNEEKNMPKEDIAADLKQTLIGSFLHLAKAVYYEVWSGLRFLNRIRFLSCNCDKVANSVSKL